MTRFFGLMFCCEFNQLSGEINFFRGDIVVQVTGGRRVIGRTKDEDWFSSSREMGELRAARKILLPKIHGLEIGLTYRA